MKRVLTTCIVSLITALAWGQGTVYFANDAVTLSGPPDRLVRFLHGNTLGNVFGTNDAPVVGTNFVAELCYRAGTVTDESLLTLASKTLRSTFRSSTTTVPGTWNNVGMATLDGVPYGAGTVTLQVRVWDINGGSSFWTCITTRGKSALFSYTVPGSSGDLPQSFFMANFQGFRIGVPEPSSLGLAGLGVALGWMWRRERRSRLPRRVGNGPSPGRV